MKNHELFVGGQRRHMVHNTTLEKREDDMHRGITGGRDAVRRVHCSKMRPPI